MDLRRRFPSPVDVMPVPKGKDRGGCNRLVKPEALFWLERST
jgi:hypothetical protein